MRATKLVSRPLLRKQKIFFRQILAYLEASLSGSNPETIPNNPLLQIFGTGISKESYLGAAPFQIVLWQPQAVTADVPLASRFEELFEREIAPGFARDSVRLRQPDPPERQAIAAALGMLNQVWPPLLVETLAHVRVFALVDLATQPVQLERGKQTAKSSENPYDFMSYSGSNYAVPGSVFLSPQVTRSPLQAAQSIFHETTHQKAANLVTTLAVCRDGYNQKHLEPVKPYWHRHRAVETLWPVDRSFFALHFYVHSIPFYSLLAEKYGELQEKFGNLGLLPTSAGNTGPEEIAGLARQGVERAAFLHEQVMLRAGEFLDKDGLDLMEWLRYLIERFAWLI